MNPTLVARRSFVLTLGLLTATAALTIDMSLPAIPAMVRSLATDLPKGQLIVGAFMLGMACGQIPAGLFSDRLGRLPVLYAGMSVFALAAIVAALAQSIDVMLAARFVQGFGGASAVVLSRAIVRDISSGKDAAKLMSLMTMIFTVAPVVAPSIGALLVAQWGWRAPFAVIAGGGMLMLIGIRSNLVETRTPDADGHPLRQLQRSFAEFFRHRQSIFGLLLIVVPPAGFMSIIAVSAALVVEIYGFSVQTYGLIFACAGLSILAGSIVNRILVPRIEIVPLIRIGIAMMAVASLQLLLVAWINAAPFAWVWGCVCLFFFAVPIVLSNAMVLALDPLPRIAGVASSIIGTIQNVIGASGAILGATIYNGTLRNAVMIIGGAGIVMLLIFLLRPLICGGPLVHHPEELARD
ncbi:MAG: Bcr/CflA family efflux MFS transporter [Gammaproteobacteria bacterium]|jgi:DHA1 family bicyclomycin/chloramphenicol resistance-like MFS transporter|nr:Bcr/CflA family efflux MFS transporter [Gammaproteobacteria bacterium]